MVYYNEYDAKTAAWLRQLIKDGFLPDGLLMSGALRMKMFINSALGINNTKSTKGDYYEIQKKNDR